MHHHRAIRARIHALVQRYRILIEQRAKAEAARTRALIRQLFRTRNQIARA